MVANVHNLGQTGSIALRNCTRRPRAKGLRELPRPWQGTLYAVLRHGGRKARPDDAALRHRRRHRITQVPQRLCLSKVGVARRLAISRNTLTLSFATSVCPSRPATIHALVTGLPVRRHGVGGWSEARSVAILRPQALSWRELDASVRRTVAGRKGSGPRSAGGSVPAGRCWVTPRAGHIDGGGHRLPAVAGRAGAALQSGCERPSRSGRCEARETTRKYR
jgi:hypothetical protein